jgi:hypothetical protein
VGNFPDAAGDSLIQEKAGRLSGWRERRAQLFDDLPDDNRLKRREKERWSMENQRDECFADMYVHPQEVDYTIDSLFELIDASGLEFVGFSNPSHLAARAAIGQDSNLLGRAQQLSETRSLPIDRSARS